MIEALKNIAGISYFPDYFSYNDLNLRKHQAQHCAQATSSMLSAPAESAVTTTCASTNNVAAEPAADAENGEEEE